MEKEKLYNLFVNFDDNILVSIGYVVHEVAGTDSEKYNFLHKNIFEDVKNMKIENIPSSYKVKDKFGDTKNGISLNIYNTMLHNATAGVLFENIFQNTNAPANPLNITTPVVNGEIKINKTLNLNSEPKGQPLYSVNETQPLYYLKKYLNDDGLDLNQLIFDDFISAIQILYNNNRYVSCIKLLMSAIDSIAFLEYGELKNVNIFDKWMQSYVELEKLNVTSKELWEYRNALLHMTNAYSRKVLANKVQPLQFYVSGYARPELQSNIKYKYFNLKLFIDVVTDGIGKWTISFNSDRNKFPDFIDRYDMILSDLRYIKIEFN